MILLNNDDQQLEVKTITQFWSKENFDELGRLENYKVIFSYTDPSPSKNYPGWTLRNYLSYIYIRFAQLLNDPKQSSNRDSLQKVASNILYNPVLHVLSLRVKLNASTHIDAEIDKSSTSFIKFFKNFTSNSTITKIIFKSGIEKIQGGDDVDTPSPVPFNVSWSKFSSQVLSVPIQTNVDQLDSKALSDTKLDLAPRPPIIGWERNKESKNRLVPRYADCSQQLDPVMISNNAVYLNLKLMKWRLVPRIDLERVHATKCLLFGAGTLGCNVARGLMVC